MFVISLTLRHYFHYAAFAMPPCCLRLPLRAIDARFYVSPPYRLLIQAAIIVATPHYASLTRHQYATAITFACSIRHCRFRHAPCLPLRRRFHTHIITRQ